MKKILAILFSIVLMVLFLSEANAASSNIIINEMQTTGATGLESDEFIEIYNAGTAPVDLTDWKIKYKSDKPATSTSSWGWSIKVSLTGTIPPAAYLIYAGTYRLSSTGGHIAVFDNSGNEVDKLGYGTASDPEGTRAPAHNAGQSIARKNLVDTDNNLTDFSIGTPTPNASNNSESPPENAPSPAPVPTPIVHPKLQLSELLPNPKGNDSGNEFVEIYNPDNSSYSLSGWQIKDDKGSTKLVGDISPYGYVSIKNTFSLNNSGGTIDIIAPDGVSSDSTTYGTAVDGASFAFDGAKWRWTSSITPDTKNIFTATTTDPGTPNTRAAAKPTEKVFESDVPEILSTDSKKILIESSSNKSNQQLGLSLIIGAVIFLVGSAIYYKKAIFLNLGNRIASIFKKS